MSDERERIATPCLDQAPQTAPASEGSEPEPTPEQTRRERVLAALLRHEARPPKRPSWWGRR